MGEMRTKTRRSLARSFRRGTLPFLSLKLFRVCKLARAWKSVHGLRLPLATIQCSFSFIWEFYLYWSNKNIVSFLSISFLETPWLVSQYWRPQESCHCKIHFTCDSSTGQATAGTALSTLPSHLAFGDLVLPPGLCYSWACQANHIEFIWLSSSISNPEVRHKEKGDNKCLQMCWCPSRFCLMTLVKGVSSGLLIVAE